MIGQRAELVASRQPAADERAAYDRVLTDALAGDATLFARMDYVEEAWRIVDPVWTMNAPVTRVRARNMGSGRSGARRRAAGRVGKPDHHRAEPDLVSDADQQGATPSAERARLRIGTRVELAMATVGAISERAAVGNCARGLQPGRRCVAALHARPGALARVPLGRGRSRRLLRHQAAALLRGGAVEREGPDSEGAPLRSEQRRRQPRRGRQGVLLLPRFHADPLLHEVALQVSPGRLSVRRSGDRRMRAGPARSSSTSSSTPVPSTTTATSMSSSNTPSRRPRNASSASPSRTVAQRAATIHLLPSLWFRNTWSWWDRRGKTATEGGEREQEHERHRRVSPGTGRAVAALRRAPTLLFTENETNNERLFDAPNAEPLRQGRLQRLHRGRKDRRGQPGSDGGTKAAAHYRLEVGAGQSVTVRLCLTDAPATARPFAAFEKTMDARRAEADEFYRTCTPESASEDTARVMRQAFGGMFWTKQYYFFDVNKWLREHGVRSVRLAVLGPGQEPPLVPHVQRRCHLDAGQVGVPVVRRLGSRLSRGRAGAHRSRTSPSINST